jgi:hypothetical protein
MKFRVFWDIQPCSQNDVDIALMMEAARTSETSVDIDLTTRLYIPEESKLQNIYQNNGWLTIYISNKFFKNVSKFI